MTIMVKNGLNHMETRNCGESLLSLPDARHDPDKRPCVGENIILFRTPHGNYHRFSYPSELHALFISMLKWLGNEIYER